MGRGHQFTRGRIALFGDAARRVNAQRRLAEYNRYAGLGISVARPLKSPAGIIRMARTKV